MQPNSNRNRPLLLSLCLFMLLFILTYPFYRTYIDPDAVAYITIAKRYAIGDYFRAVNGLWSPFSSWLIAACIRFGMEPVLASHFINGIASISIIAVTSLFFRVFQVDKLLAKALMLAMPFFLIFCHYIQLFADLWQVFFLLCYLLLVISPSFITNKYKWFLTGIIGALAYFAKAYSFYFILVHLLVALIILAKQNGLSRSAIIKPFATVLVVMLFIMSPWLYALHTKYNVWTLSTASSLNESWFLTGHKNFKPGITYLIPPPYDNSPCNWEDPYLNEGHLFKPWENPKFLLIQAGRSAVAFLQTFIALHQISIFLFAIFFVTIWWVFYKKDKALFSTQHRILLWASLILPIGYLALHMEARYIWLLAFTGMIFGAVWLHKLKERMSPSNHRLLVILFALSFVAYPLYKMPKMFIYAHHLTQVDIKGCQLQGSFTSNGKPNDMEVVALNNNMQYYTLDVSITHQDLLAELRMYHIKYYLYYFDRQVDGHTIHFYDENNRPFPIKCMLPGINIYTITP